MSVLYHVEVSGKGMLHSVSRCNTTKLRYTQGKGEGSIQ